MTQLAITSIDNRNLFSNHYLYSLVRENPEWNEDVTGAFNRAKEKYGNRKDWSRMDESMLEEFLIRPILKDVLGHQFLPQARVGIGASRPDYAFFENETALNEAIDKKGDDDLYKKAIAVGDAKRWTISLDKKIKGARGSFEFQNPSYQIDHYLHVTPVQWGILTNGRYWRIYHKETSYKLDSYYEVDLVNILEKNDAEEFKYFYLFFRLNAFLKDTSGRNFLDRVKAESIAYAKKLGENLQRNVYNAMKVLAEGFLEWKDNSLTSKEDNLKEIQENTLKLLYRLLFIFYAESLKLLDRNNPEYRKLSLEAIKADIAKKTDARELILPVTTEYWNKLNTLFTLINEGSESLGLPKELLHIPAYNGGLFDPKRNPFLQNKKIGDKYIAEAIDLLAREDKDFIDYSTLGTRQLGSIYEGLLEYKLSVATDDLVAVREKGHERWIPEKDADGKKYFDKIKAGAVYLATDKGERKATGSYYTPDYIVKYIVRSTLEPILEEKRNRWKEKGIGERPFLHDVLSIRILDPAMGSGHFLVEACEFLANKLVEAWGEARPEDLESEEVAEHDVHWARREVVRHCIFGVDLNPMAVELAKLSLWLETVAANKPLTFLDHHLKVGNSLIGAKVSDLKALPSKEKRTAAEDTKKKKTKSSTLWDFTVKQHFDVLLKKYGEFAAHPDDDLKSVKQKEEEYDALQKSEINRRLHELANCWISSYFGAAPQPDEYADMQNEMNPKDFPDWRRWRGSEWFKEAQRIAEEKRFFHWELEFPEIFYEKGAPKENPGWDAVVGNPPYGAIFSEMDKVFLKSKFDSVQNVTDASAIFVEQSLQLIANEKFSGLIVPSGWLTARMHEPLRVSLLNSCTVNTIMHLPYDVFPDAYIDTIIFIMQKAKQPVITTSNTNVFRFNLREDAQIIVSNKLPYVKVSSDIWKNDKQHRFVTTFDNSISQIQSKLNANKIDAGQLVDVSRGITPFIEVPISSANSAKGFFGSIGRYELDGNFKMVQYDDSLAEFKPEKFFRGTRLIIRRIISRQHRIHATAVSDDFVINKSYLPVIQINPDYSILYTLALINSCLFSKSFIWSSEIAKRDDFPQLDIATMKELPIRRISFTTPPARRAALVEQAKALYSEFPGAPASAKKLLDFAGARLDAKPEESDVVHDLLAHLAGQMIEMNKRKNAEIKGFLRWLEGEIGAPLEGLTGKTAIREYYASGFDALAGALAKNKKKLKDGYDPTRREPKERLQTEFNSSVEKLAPLLKQIEATDALIDAIVYRLYGLTEEEIKIVNESISGEKNEQIPKAENID